MTVTQMLFRVIARSDSDDPSPLIYASFAGHESEREGGSNPASWSFRDGPKDRTRNLEIPGSLVLLAPRNDDVEEIWIASRSLSSGAHSRDPLARDDGRICEQTDQPNEL